MGWAGQGAKSPTAELWKWNSDRECLDKGTCLESLLDCDGESEELEEAGDDWKTLEMPAAILGVLKKPATNQKPLDMSESLEEQEKPMRMWRP